MFVKLNRARMNARNKVQCKSKKRKLGRLKQLHDNPYTFQQDEQLRINASFFFPPLLFTWNSEPSIDCSSSYSPPQNSNHSACGYRVYLFLSLISFFFNIHMHPHYFWNHTWLFLLRARRPMANWLSWRERERERECVFIVYVCAFWLVFSILWLLCFIRSCKAPPLVLSKAKSLDSLSFCNPCWLDYTINRV